MSGPRSGSEFDDLANDYRKASEYDSQPLCIEDELRRAKEKLRKMAGKGPSHNKAQREPHTSIAKVESDRGRKNSRVKGNRGELDVAKMFSVWSGELVRRTPGSGGWGGSKDFGTTADLVCKKKAFPHVEVKHREGWVLDDLVTGTREDHDKSIHQWWKQCLASCPVGVLSQVREKYIVEGFLKVPLLVFRRNRQPWFVMIRQADVDANNIKLPMDHTIKVARLGTAVTLLSGLLEVWPVPKGLKNHR